MQSVKVGSVASALVKVSAACRVHGSVTQTRFCQTGETVVIRVPRYLQKRVEHVKQARGSNRLVTVRAGKLIIQSKNPDLNQSAAFVLGKFQQPSLCSQGWKHNRSFSDYFTINSTRAVAPCVAAAQKKGEEHRAPVTFKKFDICQQLVDTLDGMGITHPTTVQWQTIPKVMSGHNVLCAAETGSGKTLSYLLPIIHRLQAEQQVEVSADVEHKTLAVVLVPSRELAEQVAAVSRTLCAPFGLLTRTVGGGRGMGHIKTVFKREAPHVLVATPGALVKALRRRCLDLSELNFLVVDEADTMFDPSFVDMLTNILDHTNVASEPKETFGLDHKAQLLMVGATFPGGVGEVLSKVTDVGKMVVIKSKMLHFLMPHVNQTFLKVKGSDKILELYEALKLLQQDKGGGSVLVFCNKSATVNWLGHSLDEMGVKNTRLQGEMPAAVRAGIFHSFQKGNEDVLICTDIASRGLDTSRVRLVVNHDFPESYTDYIHRAGRVGRAGGVEDGKVISFVTHPWDVELVQNIEIAARRRASLPGMKTDICQPKLAQEGEGE